MAKVLIDAQAWLATKNTPPTTTRYLESNQRFREKWNQLWSKYRMSKPPPNRPSAPPAAASTPAAATSPILTKPLVSGTKPPPPAASPAKKFAVINRPVDAEGQRIVVYGASGAGKTTLSSLAPEPVFFDLEGSTTGLNVKIVPGIDSFKDLRDASQQALTFVPEGGTLVIDTVSKIDEWIVTYLVQTMSKRSIRELGYDRFPCTLETFRLLLGDLEPLIRSGRNVVFNAHTSIISFKNATGDDYRQEGPNLAHATNASSRDQLTAWASHVFRIAFEELTVGDTAMVGEKGKERRVGKIQNATSNRVIHTSGTASLIAKSRPIKGRHLPPVVSFANEKDDSLWQMIQNPELIPEENATA